MIRSNVGSSVVCILPFGAFQLVMVSNIDTARRALATLLGSLASKYGVAVILNRQSTDVEVSAAFNKKVVLSRLTVKVPGIGIPF